MDITRALQRAQRSYPHGTEALAAAMDLDAGSLRNKVNPNYSGAHCSPEEMQQLMELTGDFGALHALADAVGHLVLQNPCRAGDTEIECTKHLVACVKQFSEFIESVTSSNADGRIKENELKDIERECAEAMGAISALMTWASRKHEQGKPIHLRAA